MRAGGSPDHLTPLIARFGNRRLADVDQAPCGRTGRRTNRRKAINPRPSDLHAGPGGPEFRPRTEALRAGPSSASPRSATPGWTTSRPTEAETMLGLLPEPSEADLTTFYLGTGCRATEALDLDMEVTSRPPMSGPCSGTPRAAIRAAWTYSERVRGQMPARTEGKYVWLNSRGRALARLRRHQPHAQAPCRRRPSSGRCIFTCSGTPGRPGPTPARRDLTFLMQQGGWRSASMVMRYAHAASDDLARSVLDHGWGFSGRELFPKPKKGGKSLKRNGSPP
jgi:hypothetical protein